MFMDFLRKHMRTIFFITIVFFLGSALIGFGGYLFGSKNSMDAVVEVNGEKVPYRRFATMMSRVTDMMAQNKEEMNEQVRLQKKQEILQDLIQETVFWQQSKKYGISVSDAELAADIQRYPAFQRDGHFDHQTYYQTLGQILRMSPVEFEESRRRQIAMFKLRYLIASSIRITEAELRYEYARANRGNMSAFEKDRQKFFDSLRQEKTMLVFNEWFKQLNSSMKIKVNLDEIERSERGA